MICPNCGHNMGSNHRCLRCGYEVCSLATVDSDNEENENKSQDENETKIIDPNNVYITTSYDDGYAGGYTDPFSSLFDDLFGDPISSLFGGLFGIDIRGETRRRATEEPNKKKKKQGPVVEVKNVEFFDENGNKIDSDKKQAGKSGKSDGYKNAGKFKNPFKRSNDN